MKRHALRVTAIATATVTAATVLPLVTQAPAEAAPNAVTTLSVRIVNQTPFSLTMDNIQSDAGWYPNRGPESRSAAAGGLNQLSIPANSSQAYGSVMTDSRTGAQASFTALFSDATTPGLGVVNVSLSRETAPGPNGKASAWLANGTSTKITIGEYKGIEIYAQVSQRFPFDPARSGWENSDLTLTTR